MVGPGDRPRRRDEQCECATELSLAGVAEIGTHSLRTRALALYALASGGQTHRFGRTKRPMRRLVKRLRKRLGKPVVAIRSRS